MRRLLIVSRRRFSFGATVSYDPAMTHPTQETPPQTVVLVEVTRGSLIEARHRGFIVVVDSAGQIVAQLGDGSARTWYRSAAKPFQTIPIITSGAAQHFGLTAQELAVITGSHSGEDIHLTAVSSILDKIGCAETELLCGAHTPFDDVTAKQLRATGQAPRILHNNCSGKHAGMLAFAKFSQQPLANYIDPQHAIQRQIREVLARFAAVPAEEIDIAVDGCSAPVFGVSLTAMARSYAQLVAARQTGSAQDETLCQAAERVVAAMGEFPEMVGGNRNRLDTDLMRATHGQVIAKVGAEGVQLLGVKPCPRYPAGLGIAIKIEDGDIRRARDPVVIETLRQLGLLTDEQLAQLARYGRTPLFNFRRIEVGEVRTCFQL